MTIAATGASRSARRTKRSADRRARGGLESTARLVAALGRQPRATTILFLLSGGASALLAAPATGVTRSDKVALNRHLLRCGAPIEVMNAARKHVSAVKGGGLALV